MKKIIFNLVKFCIFLVVVISIYNYLDMNFFRKSVKQAYIDESYLRPNFVDEFRKLERKKEEVPPKTIDAMEMDELSLEDLVAKNSQWYIGEKDLSGLREEWNYKVFDFVKKKYGDRAEDVFREYIAIKSNEIKAIQKLEENFINLTNELLKKSNNVKDSKYYKKFYSQLKAKEQLMEQTREVMKNKKVEVFSKEGFTELEKLSEEFLFNVNQRLVEEYSFTEVEVVNVKTNVLLGKLLLVP